MKLLFFPLFIFALFQSHFFKEYSNFWCIKLIGILAGLILIPILYYTINGIFGKTPDFINIAIFFISAALAYFAEYQLFKSEKGFDINTKSAIIILAAISLLFTANTFSPPEIPLFQDPITKMYGIN